MARAIGGCIPSNERWQHCTIKEGCLFAHAAPYKLDERPGKNRQPVMKLRIEREGGLPQLIYKSFKIVNAENDDSIIDARSTNCRRQSVMLFMEALGRGAFINIHF